MRRAARTGVVWAAVLAACGVDGAGPPGNPSIAFVSLVPVAVTLEIGDTTRLIAAPRDSVGNVVLVRAPVVWRSEDARVATVDSTGRVRAEGPGETKVEARVAGVEGRATVRVVHPAIATSYQSVSAGGAHTCAVTVAGTVACWGLNTEGQLGNGSYASTDRPVVVSGEVRALALGAGTRHSCVAVAEAEPLCWGWNSVQQLGAGFTDKRSALPQPAGPAGRFTLVGAGSGHTCALSEAGAVLCWGSDAVGQNGRDVEAGAIGPVSGGQTFVDLAVGWVHNCALDEQRLAWCWGWNGFGQLGPHAPAHECALNVPCAETPVLVSASLALRTIAAGFAFSCGIDGAGAAWCWGSNADGVLGTAAAGDRAEPVRVPLAAPLTQIDAGYAHVCARSQAGDVWCWGANDFGQLGDGTRTLRPSPVVARIGDVPARAVSAGAGHTCALLEDGGLRCWGSAADGRLGPFGVPPQ